ncbi:histamine N-methyltransferase-like [Lytechinus pictus]|uniref:histamine N-methyltransferase-like n=1 Tax=Lytechinus pictus TaxID=7653 RepID=UPI0030B9D817
MSNQKATTSCQHELHYLERLGSYFTSIRNVAVDPNGGLLEIFKLNADKWSSENKARCESNWWVGQLSEFFDESPLAKCKYNMISAVHSMYHTGDLEKTFIRLMSMLKENGILLIVLSGKNMIHQTHRKKQRLPASYRYSDKPKSLQISELAKKNGFEITTVELDIKWDVTDLFDEKSELGDKLSDFLTMVAYFRKTASPETKEDLLSFWRSLCSEDEDGRMRTQAGEMIFVVTK